MRRLAAAFLVLLLSCTDDGEPPTVAPTRTGSSLPQPLEPPPSATIRLVMDDDPSLSPYRDGIDLAAAQVEIDGRIDLTLREAPSVQAAAGLDPAATLVIGDAGQLVDARPAIEAAGMPTILLGGDLYTSRSLYRWVFQTAVPWRWQARVIARYLVADRGYGSVALVTRPGPDESVARETFAAAMAEEGGSVTREISAEPGLPFVEDFGDLDAAVVVGDGALVEDVADRLTPQPPGHPQLVLSADAAVGPEVAGAHLPPGTVTPYMYTWSAWARPIPRVRAFMDRFRVMRGAEPEAHQQEGYDVYRALAEALVRTEGVGGQPLLTALEGFRDETYSSVPVRLGPDDHVFAEESHLGLFAVESDQAEIEEAEGGAFGSNLWRPILRTFTTDGEKVNFLDRDKRIFFPFWHPKRPTPKYWRSLYGIVSRPSDPLH
jgi:hypothetical protein